VHSTLAAEVEEESFLLVLVVVVLLVDEYCNVDAVAPLAV
jgi:hypothetical protein